jgi:hypothetical protein
MVDEVLILLMKSMCGSGDQVGMMMCGVHPWISANQISGSVLKGQNSTVSKQIIIIANR